MKKFRLTLAAAILSIIALNASAADSGILFSHLDDVKDLSESSVRTVLEDSRGYVWIGTEAGLKRYDGSGLTQFPSTVTGLESDFILALGEDGDGNIWVGTSKGVAVYDYGSDAFFVPKDENGSFPEANISYSFAVTPSGDVYFGTLNGDLWSYGKQDRLLHHHPLNLGRYIKSLVADGCGNLLLLTYYGYIYRYDIAGGGVHPLDIGRYTGWFDGDDVADIAFSPIADNILYVAAKSKGLCMVDLQSGDVKQLISFGENQRPTDLALSGNRYLYVSTTSDLVRYDIVSDAATVIRSGSSKDPYSLSGGGLNAVFSGNSGRLWVGTMHYGLNVYDPLSDKMHRYYRTSQGEDLEGCVVSSLAEDSAGNIWLATKRKSLLRYDKAADKLIAEKVPGLPDDLLSICADGDDLWIGTNYGIFRYVPGSRKLKHYFLIDNLSTKDNRIESVYLTLEGRVMAGCIFGGVVAYNADKDEFEYVFDSKEITIKSIAEDSTGIIWMTSFSQGLFSADTRNPGKFRKWSASSGIDVGEMLHSVLVDGGNNIWVLGSGGRIWKLDRSTSRFERFCNGSSPLLPSVSFSSGVADTDGTLWLSSSSGLLNYNPSSGGYRMFTAKEGLLDGAPTGAILRSTDGMIYCGFADGIVVFRPGELADERPAPRVDLLSMTVNGQKAQPSSKESPIESNINLVDKIELGPDQNTFAFNVAVPNSSSSVIYYCLDGYEDDLKELGRNGRLEWYDVPPGTYRLEFYFSDVNKGMSVCRDALLITVRPPFFKSFYGILIIICLAVATIALTALFFIRRDRRRIGKIMDEKERKRQEQDIRERMNFFSGVIHEIKTPLTLISSPLKDISSHYPDLPDEVKNDLDVISSGSMYMKTLVRDLLEYINAGSKEYTIRKKRADVAGIVRTVCSTFASEARQKGLTLKFESSEEVIQSIIDESSLIKILNNILINALRYARGEILVNLSVIGDSIRISVSNDGESVPESRREEIFKPFVHFDKNQESRGFGIGLTFARSLAELNDGSLVLVPSDKTEFLLTIPLISSVEATASSPAQPLTEKNGEVATILIVEDNQSLLNYMARTLSAQHNVLSCSSAESALSIIASSPVDMLLSDIKLGRMSGVELCRRITSSIDTSHIPVIMVSGIATESVKTQCMEAGAVMYIEKPFTTEYLTTAVNMVFVSRKKIISHYQDGSGATGRMNLSLQGHDADFLKKVDAAVSRHIDDTELSVVSLCEELSMSQSTLNRKLSSLLGMNANEYIKDKRLRTALDLFRASGVRINEVCYRVGFTSQSYFTRAFKEKYGKTPSEYIASKKRPA